LRCAPLRKVSKVLGLREISSVLPHMATIAQTASIARYNMMDLRWKIKGHWMWSSVCTASTFRWDPLTGDSKFSCLNIAQLGMQWKLPATVASGVVSSLIFVWTWKRRVGLSYSRSELRSTQEWNRASWDLELISVLNKKPFLLYLCYYALSIF